LSFGGRRKIGANFTAKYAQQLNSAHVNLLAALAKLHSSTEPLCRLFWLGMTKQKKTHRAKGKISRSFAREIKSQKKKMVRLFKQLQIAFNSKSDEIQSKVMDRIEEANASLAMMIAKPLGKISKRHKKLR
jgi:hypothetical protein